MSSHHDRHGHDHHHEHVHDPGFAELLDLDADVFAPAVRALHEDIAQAADAPVRSMLDLGAGSGAGTFALLQRFPDARAVAIDASAEMLAHLSRRAGVLGLGHRVTTLQADLDEGVPIAVPVDLVWASASMHHLADPDRTLLGIAAAIRPGGLLAVAELGGFPRLVPDDAPGGAAERRAHELLAADRAADMPSMGSDWGSRLTRAGLVVELSRATVLDVVPEADLLGRYAAATLSRVRGAVVDRLDQPDRDALDALLDGGPGDVRRRDDLVVAAQRWSWVARRPA